MENIVLEREEVNYKESPKHGKHRKKKSVFKKILTTFIILFIIGCATLGFLLYGPYPGFREWLITTAMTTMTHQYLATWFYSDETIQEVLNKKTR